MYVCTHTYICIFTIVTYRAISTIRTEGFASRDHHIKLGRKQRCLQTSMRTGVLNHRLESDRKRSNDKFFQDELPMSADQFESLRRFGRHLHDASSETALSLDEFNLLLRPSASPSTHLAADLAQGLEHLRQCGSQHPKATVLLGQLITFVATSDSVSVTIPFQCAECLVQICAAKTSTQQQRLYSTYTKTVHDARQGCPLIGSILDCFLPDEVPIRLKNFIAYLAHNALRAFPMYERFLSEETSDENLRTEDDNSLNPEHQT